MTQLAAPRLDLTAALEAVAAGAGARDRAADGIAGALDRLAETDAMGWNAVGGRQRPPAAAELALVRRVATADSSLGRIFDGHLNAVERLAVQAPADLAETEIALVRDHGLRVGVWGGDPRAGEGEPATVQRVGGGEVLTGVKTFCSGAGVLDRALVLARDGAAAPGETRPVTVWIDLRDPSTVTVDRDWYASSGLRASESHRVTFHGARVIARFGGPGAISAQPWFSRDALRTAASWAGMIDLAATAALSELATRPARGDLEALAAGRILAAQHTVDAWLDVAARAMDRAGTDLPDVAFHARVAIIAAAQTILAEAAAAAGSHPFATGADLDRARRDLELFLLQHRLGPGLIRDGRRALDALATGGCR